MKRKIYFGADITGMDMGDFINQLPDGWISFRSEEGWSEYLHWMSGRKVEIWMDEKEIITKYLWLR